MILSSSDSPFSSIPAFLLFHTHSLTFMISLPSWDGLGRILRPDPLPLNLNISTNNVQIPADKKTRYLIKLQPWIQGQKFSRKDAESILGTLVHCSLAVPDGRSHLPSIARFTASFNHVSSAYAHRSPNASVLIDIGWWRTQLSNPFCGSYLSRPPTASLVVFG